MKKMLALIYLISTLSFAQTYFKVVNKNNEPLKEINIFCYTNNACISLKTDKNGLALYPDKRLPSILFLNDPKSIYGIKAIIINSSQKEYVFKIPLAPKTKKEAEKMFEDFMSALSNAYGYYSIADFIANGITKAGGGLGVPGVFNINPIPTKEGDGRWAFKVSGILFNSITRWTQKITGNSFGKYYFEL